MYQKRRDQLIEQMPLNSIFCVFSGSAPYSVGDEKYPFSVDRNFYYLTGLDKENMMYMAVKYENGTAAHMLFIEPFDEQMAKWVGGRILPKEAAAISGITDIRMNDERWNTICMLLNYRMDRVGKITFLGDFTLQEDHQKRDAHIFAKELTDKYPYVSVENGAYMLTSLRLIKDDEEIEKLKKAISVTNQAILNMMKHAHADMKENELEAHFDFVLKSHNCKHSFPSIVGSGKNATILHYGDNNQTIKDDTLVLCDLGASIEYYNADITRTFPINGKFTPRQKQIYNIVLEGNRYIMSLVKPQVTLRELNTKLIEYYETELKKIGLLENGKTVRDYYWHGVSHMLGLETHDVSLSNYPLQKGNVFTIEPGLYLEEEEIGIRIEDNVLVTEDGCINLSEEIIKSAEDIEAYMSKNGE